MNIHIKWKFIVSILSMITYKQTINLEFKNYYAGSQTFHCVTVEFWHGGVRSKKIDDEHLKPLRMFNEFESIVILRVSIIGWIKNKSR